MYRPNILPAPPQLEAGSRTVHDAICAHAWSVASQLKLDNESTRRHAEAYAMHAGVFPPQLTERGDRISLETIATYLGVTKQRISQMLKLMVEQEPNVRIPQADETVLEVLYQELGELTGLPHDHVVAHLIGLLGEPMALKNLFAFVGRNWRGVPQIRIGSECSDRLSAGCVMAAGSEAHLSAVVGRAADAIRMAGAARVDTVAWAIEKRQGGPVSPTFVRRALSANPDVMWLDEAAEWFLVDRQGGRANPIKTAAVKALSVAEQPLSRPEFYSAYIRQQAGRAENADINIVPAAIFDKAMHYLNENRPSNRGDFYSDGWEHCEPKNELSPMECRLAERLPEAGSIASRSEFVELLDLESRSQKSLLSTTLRSSPIIYEVQPDVFALIGRPFSADGYRRAMSALGVDVSGP